MCMRIVVKDFAFTSVPTHPPPSYPTIQLTTSCHRFTPNQPHSPQWWTWGVNTISCHTCGKAVRALRGRAARNTVIAASAGPAALIWRFKVSNIFSAAVVVVFAFKLVGWFISRWIKAKLVQNTRPLIEAEIKRMKSKMLKPSEKNASDEVSLQHRHHFPASSACCSWLSREVKKMRWQQLALLFFLFFFDLLLTIDESESGLVGFASRQDTAQKPIPVDCITS